MPHLRNLLCEVEWNSPNHTPFKEYKTKYGDGYVECYIAIPLSPTSFVVHLKSNGYVAPGLAMYVFINGKYQCNRNRANLLVPAVGVDARDSEIDFRVRQKESTHDGAWKGKEWQFQKVKDDAEPSKDPTAARAGEYGGSIEVVVLRCFHSPPAKASLLSPISMRSNRSSARHSYIDEADVPLMTGAMFDGAGDSPPPRSRGRLRPSSQRGGEPKISSIRFKDRVASSPDPGRNRFQQRDQMTSQEILSGFRLGPGDIDTGGSSGLLGENQPITSAESTRLRLRGGGGSDHDWANNVAQPPATESTPHTSRRRRASVAPDSPKHSTGTYTPNENWANFDTTRIDEQLRKEDNGWDWANLGKDQGNQDNGINVVDWNNHGVNQTDDENHQQSNQFDEPKDEKGEQESQWNSADISGQNEQNWNDVASGNVQQEDWANVTSHDDQKKEHTENWNTSNDQGNDTGSSWPPPSKAFSRPVSPQNQSIDFGSRLNPVIPDNLNGSNGMAYKPSSVTSIKSALKSPTKVWARSGFPTVEHTTGSSVRAKSIPGAWSPPMVSGSKSARAESIKRQAAAINAEQAKIATAELNAKFPRDGPSHAKPTTPLSSRFPPPLAKTNPSMSAFPEAKIPQSRKVSPPLKVADEPVTAKANQIDPPKRESPSPVEYTHKTGHPHYMDTLTDPYARFVFEYREDTVISDMCDIDVEEPKEELRDRLTTLTKEALINLLIEEREEAMKEPNDKETLKSSLNSAGYQPNLSAANDKLNQWEQNTGGGTNGRAKGNSNSGGTDGGNGKNKVNGWASNVSGGNANQGGSGSNGRSGGSNKSRRNSKQSGNGDSAHWNAGGGSSNQGGNGGNGDDNQGDAAWANTTSSPPKQAAWDEGNNQGDAGWANTTSSPPQQAAWDEGNNQDGNNGANSSGNNENASNGGGGMQW